MLLAKTWTLLVYSSFICFIAAGSASSPPEGESKAPQIDASKNASSADNRLPDLVPTPPPENCSERIHQEKRDCPSNMECSKLGRECLQCDFNCTCVYGTNLTVMCQPKEGVKCQGVRNFPVEMRCQYCYQTEHWQHSCLGTDQCLAVSSPRATFTSNCTVNSDVLCMGNRVFPKKLPCNWTSGYQWSTALLLSITLGGFGADRFYLGHWQEGIGKLFSFGGLGVWTIIDVILIAIRYIGPADGSLYI